MKSQKYYSSVKYEAQARVTKIYLNILLLSSFVFGAWGSVVVKALRY